MATDWASRGTAGSHRSDGGAMRIRGSPFVLVDSCTVYATLRGIRIQDCGIGGSCRIINCRADSCLESAFYCAAGDYTGASGTENMFIGNCRADNIFHHGYLVIGGANVTITSCQAVNCASSAVVAFHTQDLRVVGCTFDECTSKTYIGIGVPGDNFGCVYFSSKEGLTSTGGYMLTALNNSMTLCGQGRAATVTGFYFGSFDTSVSSYRAIIDGNNMDAATPVYKDDQDIPLVSTQYPQFLSLIVANDQDIGTNSGNITTNATDITTAEGNIVGNAADIATNAADILTANSNITVNDNLIAGKEDTLIFATVEDDHASRPVTSEKIKAYVDANAGGSGAGLGANTFTDSQQIVKNGNCSLLVKHSGYADGISLVDNFGDAGIIYHGKSSIKFNGARIMCGDGSCLTHRACTKTTTNAAHGALCVDDAAGATALKLYFHTGTAWREVSLV